MCGIAGLVVAVTTGAKRTLQRMGDNLAHRGPDGAGIWLDSVAGIGLAHRRLAVVDLSPAGAQPMQSADGRWVVTFNGEIYNHRQLRATIESHESIAWHGHSDTEVLVECLARMGVEETLRRANGMFALAAWDRFEHRLYLARDRMGEKPLYVAWIQGGIAFASETKALRSVPGFRATPDQEAIGLLLRYGYVPAPRAIYCDCYKPLPGCYLRLDGARLNPPTGASEFQSWCQPYWRLASVAGEGLKRQREASPDEMTSELDRLMHESISLRMVADVPVGVFLSGGIDSSLVAAIMQHRSNRPIRTFTIGFKEAGFNESLHAEAIASHLGTEHQMLILHADDALGRVSELPQIYDEPLADPSQLPTTLLAEFTRQHVTVSLSGDGGDELFFGYKRYFNSQRLWSHYRHIPKGLRQLAAGALDKLLPILPGHARRLGRIAGTLSGTSAAELHWVFAGLWPNGANPAAESLTLPTDPCRDCWAEAEIPGSAERMMYFDQVCYLPDDLMVKTDRASMSVALEVRMPFLDPAIVDFAWRLPHSLKQRGSSGKLLLRELLARYVPRALFEREKQGFAVPLDAWLRGPLRAWANDLLAEERLREEGHLDARLVRATWQMHLSGRRDHAHALWAVLSLQAWLERQRRDGLMK
jgi:asparagine synthase (glutamine-hydrolysing)